MPPTEEKQIPTSAGMETATETVNRIQDTRQSAGTLNMSELATDQPTVNMPTPTLPANEVAATRGAANGVLDQLQTQTQQREAQAGQVLSESDRKIREAMGILGTQTETRDQLEGEAGVDQFQEDINRFQTQLRQQVAQLDQFDLDNTNTLEQMRVDASKRDITKRTFNAMSAEANIQNAVTRANMVAQTRATVAAVQVTQGNLQQATQEVDKAMKSIYEPARMGLEMEMFFNERNFSQFTAAQKESSNARMMGIQRELQEIDKIQENVSTALSTGAASSDEVLTLADPNTSNDVRFAKSQEIISRAAVENRNFEIAAKESALMTAQAQRTNIYDQINQRNIARQQAIEQSIQEAETEQEGIEAEKELASESLLEMNQLLTDVTDMTGMSSAVGLGFKKSVVGSIPFVSGEAIRGSARQDFEIAANRLADMFLVKNLDKMTGVLTDKDLEVLRNEGTTIGNFDQSEKAWNKERHRLEKMIQRGIEKNGVTLEQATHFEFISQSEGSSLDEIWNNL